MSQSQLTGGFQSCEFSRRCRFPSDSNKPVFSIVPLKKNKLGTNETEVDKN